MEINRGNYEAYFLDYFENRLEPREVAELMVFLQENPDLNDAFESFDPVILEPESFPCTIKEGLKKQNYKPVGEIDAYNYEQWMVAGLEGDLSAKQENNLNGFLLENPNARLEYSVFKKTRLIPGPEIFEDKSNLKKKTLFVAYRTQWLTAITVAASLVLFIGLYFGNRFRNQEPERIQMTEAETIQAPLLQLEEKVPERINIRSMNQHTVVSEQTTLNAKSPQTVYFSINTNLQQLNHRKINRIALPAPDKVVLLERQTKYGVFLAQNIKPEEKRRGFAGRFIQGLFRKTLPKMDQKSLLEYTLDGYNLMADRDVELEKEYDDSGKVVAYRINGENIRIGQKVQPPLNE